MHLHLKSNMNTVIVPYIVLVMILFISLAYSILWSPGCTYQYQEKNYSLKNELDLGVHCLVSFNGGISIREDS